MVSLTALSFLGALDHTIVAATLPTIAGELNAVAHMSWIVVGYTLAATVTLPVFGAFADRHDPRRVLFGSTLLFLLGSLLCGFAGSIEAMTAARILQGIGSAGMNLLPQTLIGRIVPARQRPAIMSLIGGAFPIAIVVGPVLGGLISDHVGWPWVFWINVPLGLAALAFARAGIPRLDAVVAHGDRKPFDLLGTLATTLLTTGLVLALTWGAGDFGWTHGWTIGAAAVSVVAGVALVPIERRARAPIFPVQVLRRRAVGLATTLSVIVGVGLFAIVQYIPTWVQMVYGVSATAAGVVPMAMVLSMMVATFVSGFVVTRTGTYRWAIIGGTALGGLGMAGLACLALAPQRWGLPAPAGLLGLAGLGVGSFMMLTVTIAQAGAARAALGTVTSVVNLSRSIAATSASAVVGAWLGVHVTAGLPSGISVDELAPASVLAKPADVREAVAGLYASGMTPVFIALAAVFVIGVAAAVALPRDMLRGEDPHGSESLTPAGMRPGLPGPGRR